MKSSTPKGLKNLRKKWWKATLADVKRLGLPKPNHDYGWSWPVLKAALTEEEYNKFSDWMSGQTQMLDEKLGPIAYTHDVIRGIDLIRNKVPTYWD